MNYLPGCLILDALVINSRVLCESRKVMITIDQTLLINPTSRGYASLNSREELHPLFFRTAESGSFDYPLHAIAKLDAVLKNNVDRMRCAARVLFHVDLSFGYLTVQSASLQTSFTGRYSMLAPTIPAARLVKPDPTSAPSAPAPSRNSTSVEAAVTPVPAPASSDANRAASESSLPWPSGISASPPSPRSPPPFHR